MRQYAAAESRLGQTFAGATSAFASASGTSSSQSQAAAAAKTLATAASSYANGLAALHPPASVALAANAVIGDERQEASLLSQLASAISANDQSTGTALESRFQSLLSKVQSDTAALASAMVSAEK